MLIYFAVAVLSATSVALERECFPVRQANPPARLHELFADRIQRKIVVHKADSKIFDLLVVGDHLFAATGRSELLDFDLTTAQTTAPTLKFTARSHKGSVLKLAWAGYLASPVSASRDKRAFVWNTAVCPLVRHHVLVGHDDAVTALVVHGHVLYTGSADRTILRWDLRQSPPRRKNTPITLHTLPVLSMASAGDWMCSGDAGGVIAVWDLVAGRLARTFVLGSPPADLPLVFNPKAPLRSRNVTALAMHGEFVFAAHLSVVRVWNIHAVGEQPVAVLEQPPSTGYVLSLIVADGFLLCGMSLNTVVVWALDAAHPPRMVTTLFHHGLGAVYGLAVAHNRVFAAGLHGRIVMFARSALGLPRASTQHHAETDQHDRRHTDEL